MAWKMLVVVLVSFLGASAYVAHPSSVVSVDQTWSFGTHRVTGLQTVDNCVVTLAAQEGPVIVKVDPGVNCFLLKGDAKIVTAGAHEVIVTSSYDNTVGEQVLFGNPSPGDYGYFCRVVSGGRIFLNNFTGRYGTKDSGYICYSLDRNRPEDTLRLSNCTLTKMKVGGRYTSGSVIISYGYTRGPGPFLFSNVRIDSIYGGNELYGHYLNIGRSNGPDSFVNFYCGGSIDAPFSSVIYYQSAGGNVFMNNVCIENRSWSAIEFFSESFEPNTLSVSNTTVRPAYDYDDGLDQDGVFAGNVGNGSLDVIVSNSVFSLYPHEFATGIDLNNSFGGGSLRGVVRGVCGYGMLGGCPWWCGGIVSAQEGASVVATDTFQTASDPVGVLPYGCVRDTYVRIPDGFATVSEEAFKKGYGTLSDNGVDTSVQSSTGTFYVSSDITTPGYQYYLSRFRMPELDSIRPSSGIVGDTITLRGRYFQQGRPGKARVGSSKATIIIQNDTLVVIIVPRMLPNNKIRTKDVAYTTYDNNTVTLPRSFTYR